MITEIAQIDVKPGTEAEFEKGVKQAVPIFKRAKGCRSIGLPGMAQAGRALLRCAAGCGACERSGARVLAHDPEKACSGLDPGWEQVSRLRDNDSI
jgi:hypothetical protein